VQPSATAAPTDSHRVEICDPSEEPDEAPAGHVLVFFTCVRPPAVAGAERPTHADSAEELLTAALDELLAEPTNDEQEQGLRSWFSSDTAGSLNRVSIDDEGVAVVDFAGFSEVIPNASTTAGRLQLMSELRATIFQFDSVESAVLQFDGNCGAFWIWVANNP
jgi:spore germination protein GerM